MDGPMPSASTLAEMGIVSKKPNTLPTWGNYSTMNLNPLIHTNIETSPYFNGRLQELKTYHELVDEIYYKVTHLEPWEKGSRNAGGRRQTGMCGGVRGVGLGGIVSSAFCILFRLYSLRLTRKQVYGLMNHGDSPYIRGLGFLYVRYSQPPSDFWEWFEGYIDDEEEVDVRAGGGGVMRMGELVRHLITRQDWFSTLFPRIPVPIQITIDKRLAALKHQTSVDPAPQQQYQAPVQMEQQQREEEPRASSNRGRERDRDHDRDSRRRKSRSRSRSRSRERSRHKKSKRSRSRSRSRESKRHHKDKKKRSRSRERKRDKDRR